MTPYESDMISQKIASLKKVVSEQKSEIYRLNADNIRLRAERDAYAKDFKRTQRTEPAIQPMGRVE